MQRNTIAMSKKRIEDLKIVRNRRLNSEYHVIELTSSEKLPEILPGQFAEVLVDNSKNTFLRRPLSIHDVDYQNNTLSLLIQIKGEGTEQLVSMEEGDFMNLVYPLGNGFGIEEPGKVLLIGGGCGVAPLLYLSRILNEKGFDVHTLIGVRSQEYLILENEYAKYGTLHITTEDGSVGEKGFVVHHSEFSRLNDYDKIYTCGPEVMMKAIAKRASEANVNCEVSLENLMACGIGACLCCVTDTHHGRKCVCTEGPVFNINEWVW